MCGEEVRLPRLVRRLAPDWWRSDLDVEPSAVVEVVARLRARSKVVVRGRSDWTIAST
jgi:hypothetical protein